MQKKLENLFFLKFSFSEKATKISFSGRILPSHRMTTSLPENSLSLSPRAKAEEDGEVVISTFT